MLARCLDDLFLPLAIPLHAQKSRASLHMSGDTVQAYPLFSWRKAPATHARDGKSSLLLVAALTTSLLWTACHAGSARYSTSFCM